MSRAQRHQSLAELLGELGAKVTETTELLGAPAERVPSPEEIANGWRRNVEAAQRRAAEPPPETRECENCGKQKPIDEMNTVFLPGTGESYQCGECCGHGHG